MGTWDRVGAYLEETRTALRWRSWSDWCGGLLFTGLGCLCLLEWCTLIHSLDNLVKAGVCIAAGLCYVLLFPFRTVGQMDAARYLDERAGLQERFQTFVYLDKAGMLEREMPSAVAEDVALQMAGIRELMRFPALLSPRWRYLLVPVVLIVGAHLMEPLALQSMEGNQAGGAMVLRSAKAFRADEAETPVVEPQAGRKTDESVPPMAGKEPSFVPAGSVPDVEAAEPVPAATAQLGDTQQPPGVPAGGSGTGTGSRVRARQYATRVELAPVSPGAVRPEEPAEIRISPTEPDAQAQLRQIPPRFRQGVAAYLQRLYEMK